MTSCIRRYLIGIGIIFGAAIEPAFGMDDGELPVGARSQDVKAIVERAMNAFDIPGVAVAIVKDGELVLAEGYGVRKAGGQSPVDDETLFAIASNTKAMTAAALAILVDDKAVSWDDRVVEYIPGFRLYDAYVTHEFRIRDLLIHQSGLGAYSGDLMFWPETDFEIGDVIAGLRYLPQESGFRTDYAYDNLLYAVAGEVVAQASGMSWADFLEKRLFAPAGMKNCHALPERAPRRNVATPHVKVDGALVEETPKDYGAVAPAGSVVCDVKGVGAWLALMLRKGKPAGGAPVFSHTQYDALTRPRTFRKVAAVDKDIYETKFSTYALGWRVADADGALMLSHTGGFVGMFTATAMLPELGVGVAVLTNQQSSFGRSAIVTSILKAYLNNEDRDWVGYFKNLSEQEHSGFDESEAAVAAQIATADPPPLPLSAYEGVYTDNWRGEMYVRAEDGRLTLEFSRTKYMKGALEHYRNGVFVVRWFDRRLQADAFVRFSTGFDGNVDGAAMKAISDRTDPSYDFHNLDFRKRDAPAK